VSLLLFLQTFCGQFLGSSWAVPGQFMGNIQWQFMGSFLVSFSVILWEVFYAILRQTLLIEITLFTGKINERKKIERLFTKDEFYLIWFRVTS
jgi:hypothetical protein